MDTVTDKVDKVMRLAVARTLKRRAQTPVDALQQTSAAWHAVIVDLVLTAHQYEPGPLRLAAMDQFELKEEMQLHESVGALQAYWNLKNIEQPWQDEDLFQPSFDYAKVYLQ